MGMGKKFPDNALTKIASLENRLSGALKPVAPRQEFVSSLGRNMHTGYRPTLVNNVTNWHLWALVVAGIASVSVGLAFLVKAIIESSGKKRRVVLPE